jgi:Fe-S cluster biogenesis protein NfuA/nitrite reductase/ring-hydroxylating ferredoxin subunit
MRDSPNLTEVGSRIDGLLEELGSVGDRSTQEKIEELVRMLMELYGSGLARIIEIVALDEAVADRVLGKLVDDELIEGLLVLHGLHPVTVDERIHQALEKVRPYLGSHAGGVEYLGIDDNDIVHLRLEGSCDGCPSSTVTVKFAIEQAIQKAAPEVVGVHVEGVTEPEPPVQGLVQIAPLGTRSSQPAVGQSHPDVALDWATLDELGTLLSGELKVIEVGRSRVLLCCSGGNLYAYRDSCPACLSSFRDGSLDDERLACPVCARCYDVRLAGRSTNDERLHLDPLPLLTDNDEVSIALPTGVGL